MSTTKTNRDDRALNDEITEEALGHVIGGADGGAAPAPAPKCKPGEASCTDATKPWGEWG